jgi:hypothetical protein
MSWIHIEDTTPKARKDYRCLLCERLIPKGIIHVARFGVGDEGKVKVRMHTACELMTRKWGVEEWENQDPYEFRKEMEE